jgi:tripartite-type tricarboxylate transporter receptor subunit TctC
MCKYPPAHHKSETSMTIPRRALLALSAAAALAAPAFAQDKYPSKPVTFIVPQAAGGANDAIARVLAHRALQEHARGLLGHDQVRTAALGQGGQGFGRVD